MDILDVRRCRSWSSSCCSSTSELHSSLGNFLICYLMLERLKAKGEKGAAEDEMVRWHHWLNGHELEQTLGDSGGQRNLACCSPGGYRESDMTSWLNNNNHHLRDGIIVIVSTLPNDWTESLVIFHLEPRDACPWTWPLYVVFPGLLSPWLLGGCGPSGCRKLGRKWGVSCPRSLPCAASLAVAMSPLCPAPSGQILPRFYLLPGGPCTPCSHVSIAVCLCLSGCKWPLPPKV